jgi:hypothetical protein
MYSLACIRLVISIVNLYHYLLNILTVSHSHVFLCLQAQQTSVCALWSSLTCTFSDRFCSHFYPWAFNISTSILKIQFTWNTPLYIYMYSFRHHNAVLVLFNVSIWYSLSYYYFYSTTMSALCSASGTWHRIRNKVVDNS